MVVACYTIGQTICKTCRYNNLVGITKENGAEGSSIAQRFHHHHHQVVFLCTVIYRYISEGNFLITDKLIGRLPEIGLQAGVNNSAL